MNQVVVPPVVLTYQLEYGQSNLTLSTEACFAIKVVLRTAFRTRCIWTFRNNEVSLHLRSIMPALEMGDGLEEEVLWVHTTPQDRWDFYNTVEALRWDVYPATLILTCQPRASEAERASRGLFGDADWADGFLGLNPWAHVGPEYVLAGSSLGVNARVASSVAPPMFQLYFNARRFADMIMPDPVIDLYNLESDGDEDGVEVVFENEDTNVLVGNTTDVVPETDESGNEPSVNGPAISGSLEF